MSNMFHYNNLYEPTRESYATPLKYQDDDGYFWSFGEKVFYKDLKQKLIDEAGKPTTQDKGKMVRKIFYTYCSYILLKIVLELKDFSFPKTFKIEETEQHYYTHQIYKDIQI